jgi:tripartite-type tricarboxylate transporter receptor subunit TctC
MAHAADAWPARPVRFIVPFPPGGPVDTTARAFTQKLGEIWQQPNLVDNRAGAGGMVGAALAAKEPADGYTLFVGSIHHAVNPALQPKMTYDIERDFAPVSFAAMFPVFLVAHPSVPASNVRELIALAKSGNGLSFGSSGNGGGTHLAGELFNMHAGIKLPEVPTIAESGLPEYEAYSWAALFAPARTPPALLARINTDFNTALRDASVRQRLLTAGAEADPGTPQQMRERLHSELRKWAQVVKVAGIQAD